MERTAEGPQLRLCPSGCDRYVTVPFLMFWLCGWAAGEGFALWLLVKGGIALLTGQPPGPGHAPLEMGAALAAGLFLVVWLTLWTVGGVMAIAELLRLLWGEDRITVAGGRLVVSRSRGPFRSQRSFDRSAIRRISLIGQHQRLGLETIEERIELSGLGTPAERVQGASALRAELDIPEEPPASSTALPKDWEEIITPEGERALVPDLTIRRRQARIANVATVLLAALTFVIARESVHRPDLLLAVFILLAFTIGSAVGSLWLSRGRWEWRLTKGRLTLRKRYGNGVRDVFEARKLLLDRSKDSDGDPWYALYALAEGESSSSGRAIWHHSTPKKSRTVARRMNEPGAIRDLGMWLSRETGLELDDRSTRDAERMELAELKTLLENSGRFGRWAAKAVDRLGDPDRKAGP